MFAARKMMQGGKKKPELLWSRSASLTGSASSQAITNDSGAVAGDLLVMVIGGTAASAVTISPDTGWTKAFEYTAASAPTLAVFWKVATGSEPATYTFPFSGSLSERVLAFLRFRNAKFDVVGAVGTAASGANVVVPSITAKAGILCAVGRGRYVDGSQTYSASGMTVETQSSTGGQGAITVLRQTIGAGATGSRTLVPSSSRAAQSGVLFSIKGK